MSTPESHFQGRKLPQWLQDMVAITTKIFPQHFLARSNFCKGWGVSWVHRDRRGQCWENNLLTASSSWDFWSPMWISRQAPKEKQIDLRPWQATTSLGWWTFKTLLPLHTKRLGNENWTQTFFFSNFSGASGISRQNPGISRQKNLISLISRDIPNFSAPTPSRERPPPHRKISGPKSLGLASFFFPERLPN